MRWLNWLRLRAWGFPPFRISIPYSLIFGFALVLPFLVAGSAWAQCQDCSPPAPIDVLGAHGNGGRGCIACHAPHSAGAPPDANGALAIGGTALWGMGTPDYGGSVTFGDSGHSVHMVPPDLTTADSDVSGILLCLSCHDGNITPQNMLSAKSYEQQLGLFPQVRHQAIPTLLGDELAGSYAVDHPLGKDAKIALGNGLEFVEGQFLVKPGTPYARFVANYGWPTLAPMQRSNPYGIDRDGQPYLVCTTCHNQHAMNVYVAGPGSPIGGSDRRQAYATFFFVNGPYNPNIYAVNNQNSTSGMQFCRQCHFTLANEGNNSITIPTLFF